MESVVDEVEGLLSKTYEYVDRAANADRKTDPDTYYSAMSYVSATVEEAWKTIALALELSGAPELKKALDADLKEQTKQSLSYDDEGDPYSPALVSVRGWVMRLKAVYGIKSGRTAQREHLRHLLRQTAEIVHLFGVEPEKEKHVSDPVYKIVRLSFPDAVSEPHLTRPLRNFKPEFGIPSLATVVEYKYTASEAETKKVLAGLYEDMKGYSVSAV